MKEYKTSEKQRERAKKYYWEHRGKRLRYAKEFRKENKEKIKKYNKKWYESHKNETRKHKKEWRKAHPEYNKKWRETHSGYNKKWYKAHKNERKDYIKHYFQTPKGKESQTKHNSKRRQLGFTPLNNYFPGSEAHHITHSEVIYIPKSLHRSIYHNNFTGEGMKDINREAITFLYNQIIGKEIINPQLKLF